MSANTLTAYPRLIRLVGFLMALGFAGITLWNTYRLIQRIEDDEKKQMKLWGLAQQKLASNKDLDNPIAPMTFMILTAENSIPMIVVDGQNNLLFSNNINQRILAQDSLGYIQQLIEEFGAVHAPIDIIYKDSLYQKNVLRQIKSNLSIKVLPFCFFIDCHVYRRAGLRLLQNQSASS